MLIEKQHAGCLPDPIIGCPLQNVCRLAQNLKAGTRPSRLSVLIPAYWNGHCHNFIADLYYGD